MKKLLKSDRAGPEPRNLAPESAFLTRRRKKGGAKKIFLKEKAAPIFMRKKKKTVDLGNYKWTQ